MICLFCFQKVYHDGYNTRDNVHFYECDSCQATFVYNGLDMINVIRYSFTIGCDDWCYTITHIPSEDCTVLQKEFYSYEDAVPEIVIKPAINLTPQNARKKLPTIITFS